ncbi:hypothetical protein D3C75_500160 [compost metagenome]
MHFIESGFGNGHEAFIEKRYSKGTNIIFSDDNNKGKTLTIQGLMYSIGNDPIFPSGFIYQDYYFYSKFIFNEKEFLFLRKRNSFLVKSGSETHLLDSVAELKRFFNENIYTLPKINKDGILKTTDLALFFQLFFLPQDNRDTSNVIGGGYYNKGDFIAMLHALFDEDLTPAPAEHLNFVKKEISDIKAEIKDLSKLQKLAKRTPQVSMIANSNTDRAAYEETKRKVAIINDRITENQKKRNKETSFKVRLESLISELNSLNRELEIGRVACGECGSKKVIYGNRDFAFEVSNQDIRNEVITTIKSEISLKDEIIMELTREINNDQLVMTRELEVLPKDIKTIMLKHEEILADAQIGKRITQLNSDLISNQAILDASSEKDIKSSAKKTAVAEDLVQKMQSIYQEMDPEGGLIFDGVFSKKGMVYSGSEGQEFYFSKIVSLKELLDHPFPIIIDAFRDGELSTAKERYAITRINELTGQKILSSTLKQQEYEHNIYSTFESVNAIDYSNNPTSKILNKEDVKRLTEIVASFNIVL